MHSCILGVNNWARDFCTISHFYHTKMEKWMNSEGQQRPAVKLFPVIDFSDTMQEKKFQEPLLTTLGENLVATWKFWLLFQWLS